MRQIVLLPSGNFFVKYWAKLIDFVAEIRNCGISDEMWERAFFFFGDPTAKIGILRSIKREGLFLFVWKSSPL